MKTIIAIIILSLSVSAFAAPTIINTGRGNLRIIAPGPQGMPGPIGNAETALPTISCSTSYTINPALGTIVPLIVNGPCLVDATALLPTQSFTLYLYQQGTVMPSFSSKFKWQNGIGPTLSTSAGQNDAVFCSTPDGVNLICGAIINWR